MIEDVSQLQSREEAPALPKGWVRTTLGDIITFEYGKALREDRRDRNGSVPVYGSNGIVGYHSVPLIEQPCLVVGRKGTAGQVHMSRLPCWTIDTTYYVVPPEGVDLASLYYLMSTLRLGSLDRSTAIPGLNRNDAYPLSIPLPPLAEQYRIVGKIEELFTKLDAGVGGLKKIKAQLKRYRQAVLKHAFEGKLTQEWREAQKAELEPASVLLERIREERKTSVNAKLREQPPLDTSDLPELPERWGWAMVGQVGQVETGTTPSKSKPEYYGNDYPFYKPTDLNAGYHTRRSEDGLTTEGIEEARLLPKKSILVTCIGATIGKTGFIRQEGASNQQINAIITEGNISPEYIYFICISPQFQKSIIEHASATTLPILSKRKFEVLPLPLPPLPEQHRIVEEIERYFSVADEIENAVGQSLMRAERLRQSILKKAFEGRLVPQDPSDEPADRLLERIQEERARLKENDSTAKSKSDRQLRLV